MQYETIVFSAKYMVIIAGQYIFYNVHSENLDETELEDLHWSFCKCIRFL